MTTFISCSDISDNPVIDPNPLASIIGSKTWWADYKLDGEYVWSKDDIDPYSRIIETYSFSTDGSGVWNRFYLKDDESEPFALSKQSVSPIRRASNISHVKHQMMN